MKLPPSIDSSITISNSNASVTRKIAISLSIKFLSDRLPRSSRDCRHAIWKIVRCNIAQLEAPAIEVKVSFQRGLRTEQLIKIYWNTKRGRNKKKGEAQTLTVQWILLAVRELGLCEDDVSAVIWRGNEKSFKRFKFQFHSFHVWSEHNMTQFKNSSHNNNTIDGNHYRASASDIT